ncbi:DUF4233 domain-containing protein [Allosalinactinospora lopnorensis]|uniref:DUF4233 domain-containing protein n=1 Tax=Allosalinactinospora lopnorensis TaxID=1352348 RepID=UPI000623B9A2|nr:DUF4233 domain-containing protein [Allosalinactinospora lopnorensis]
MRTLCAVVLAFEAVVIGLAVPVAIQLGGHSPALAGGVWGGLAVAALLLAALQRFRWAYYAGWVLQMALVTSGFLVPGLVVLGVIFAGLWIAAIVVGTRTDALRQAAEREAAPETGGSEEGDKDESAAQR